MTINGLTIDNNDIVGLAIISDSLEVSASAGSFTVGLNGFVIYTRDYIERRLIFECRSKTVAQDFLAMAKVGNAVAYDGNSYYVEEPVTLVENYGETGGAWSGASWRYNLVLVREE